MKDRKILITGGAGFIGSHLAESLSSDNEVHIIDNLLMGSKVNLPAKCTFHEDCASNISNIYGKNYFDILFHFGEYSRVEPSLKQDIICLKNTICTFPHILDFVKDSKTKLIYSGSSTKFAQPNADTHLCPYSFAKMKNTELLEAYAEWYKLDYATVYFYNVYGGRERASTEHGTVIAKFKKMVEHGCEVLPVTSPGTQLRNFTFIDDVISALKLVAEYGNGDGFGIGDDHSYTILEVCKLFGCTPQMLPANTANRQSAELITTKTKNLGWLPTGKLADYISTISKNI
jgi:UDP-glucose 4-epimerase